MKFTPRAGGFSKDDEMIIIVQVISEMFIRPRNKILGRLSINTLFDLGHKAIYQAYHDCHGRHIEPTESILKAAVEAWFMSSIPIAQ